MMMTVDEKLHAYAKNQKDRNIDEKKLQQTIIKSKEAYWDGEIERSKLRIYRSTGGLLKGQYY